MALKTETFELSARKGLGVLQKKLQKWLDEHDHIKVISTEFASYNDKIGYIVIYRDTFHEPELVQYNSFQRPPAQPQPQAAPQTAPETYHYETAVEPEPQAPTAFEQERPRENSPKGFTTDALFGNLKTFE